MSLYNYHTYVIYGVGSKGCYGNWCDLWTLELQAYDYPRILYHLGSNPYYHGECIYILWGWF